MRQCAAVRVESEPAVGDPTPNLVLVPIDPATRRVCLFTFKATHLVADLTGWFAPGGGRMHPVTPARLLDTRSSAAPPGTTPPPDGSRPVAGTVIELPVAGAGVVPAGAAAVAVNVTVDQTAAPGYVTAFPCGTPPPLASNVNYLASDTRATQVMVGLGTGGRSCLFTYAGAHLIVDVTAWFEPPMPVGRRYRRTSASSRRWWPSDCWTPATASEASAVGSPPESNGHGSRWRRDACRTAPPRSS